MKKIWLALAGFILTCCVSAAPFTDGQQYITLPKPVTDAPPVMEFFSFYCPHCYQFEHIYHVSDAVKNNLPAGVKMNRYHVDFLGGEMGSVLTHSWAVAIALGVEDKVTEPLFDGIQNTQTISDPETLKSTFIKAAGITAEEYDAAWNSFVVKALVVQQQRAAEDVKLTGVPAMFVNGRYMINTGGFDATSGENVVLEYANVVKFLLENK